MKTYLDSSALVKLYYPEAESERVSRWVSQSNQPLLFTSIHELELQNTFALKVFRGEIKPSQMKQALRLVEGDLKRGLFLKQDIHWGELFAVALQLSYRHTRKIGCRSLDILHVSLASSFECSHFISFDDRQIRLARKAGLKPVRI
ncbi:MAG: type II toxin-antitoxin system VapC family toxin [Deltaproteobacteria bacterium]|nr:type II toxin-antitoxin system VapC family toxin [Deltaproteobacteria bacterium]